MNPYQESLLLDMAMARGGGGGVGTGSSQASTGVDVPGNVRRNAEKKEA